MVEKTAVIRNAHGIHCRPSAVIVKKASAYPGKIRVVGEWGESDLTSVMDLMVMQLAQGSKVTIQVTGENEEAMCDELVKLFETHFDFPPREDAACDMPTGTEANK